MPLTVNIIPAMRPGTKSFEGMVVRFVDVDYQNGSLRDKRLEYQICYEIEVEARSNFR